MKSNNSKSTHFFRQFKVKPLNEIPDLYTAESDFECTGELNGLPCKHRFSTSLSKAKAKIFKRNADNPSEAESATLLCKKHSQFFKRRKSKAFQYSQMSSPELIELTSKNGPLHSHYLDTPHYEEIRKRKLTENVLIKYGRSRKRPDFASYTLEDWRAFLIKYRFHNRSAWKKQDSFSMKHFYAADEEWQNILVEEFFSTALVFRTRDGGLIQCASYAELIVAKIFDELNLSFGAHPEWPFGHKSDKRKCKADFFIEHQGRRIFIEIWMFKNTLVKETDLNDKFISQYLQKREFKERNITQHMHSVCDEFVSIEARTLRDRGLNDYLEEVKSVLHKLGIPQLNHITADMFSETQKLIFEIKSHPTTEIIRYAQKHDLKVITDFPDNFVRLLRKHPLKKAEVEVALAKMNGRPANTRITGKAPLQEVISYVTERPQLHSKNAYINAHKNGKLPVGFPAAPHLHYPRLKSWGELWGEPMLVNFTKATEIVRKLNIKGKTDFEKRRRNAKASKNLEHSDFDLLKVRGNPGNFTSGGYSEFTTWSEFTNHPEAISQRATAINNEKYITLLLDASDEKILDVLLTLGANDVNTLRQKIGATAMHLFNQHQKNIFFEVILFGESRKTLKDFAALVKIAPAEDFQTEKKWAKTKQTTPLKRLFPTKIYRYMREDKEIGWAETRSALQHLREAGTPMLPQTAEGLALLKKFGVCQIETLSMPR